MRYLFSSNSSKQHTKYVFQLYGNSYLLDVLNNNAPLPDLKKYTYANILNEVYKQHINRRGID